MMGAGGAAPLPPMDEEALMAMLGAGAPLPGMGAAPVDPMAAPAMPMAGPIPGFPSTDPNAIAQLRAADHAALDAAQDAAMAQASSMSMAASEMGGAMPAPAGAAPMGDPMMVPGAPPLGDPSMGAAASVIPGLPPELAAAMGGPDMGGLESESVSMLPADEFAGELGAY